MEPPRYTAAELADYIRICQGDRAPVTLGVGIYQDGTIGEESFTVLKQFRRLVRNRPATGQTTRSTTFLPRTAPPPKARCRPARRRTAWREPASPPSPQEQSVGEEVVCTFSTRGMP